MTAEQFTYWMQGFAELSGDAPPSAEQWKSIRAHLATVFTKVTPAVDLSKLRVGVPPSPTDASKPIPWLPNIAQRPASIDPLRSECAARFEPLANGADTI